MSDPSLPANPASHEQRYRYAGLVSRVAAIVVDALIVTGAVLVVGALPPAAANAVLGDSPHWLSVVCGTAGALLPWAYFTLCWALTGETIGGLVFGLQLRRTDGRPVSPLRAAVRAFVGLFLAPLWIVGLLGILADDRRRAWLDRVFGTVVRYADRSRDPGWRRPMSSPTRPD